MNSFAVIQLKFMLKCAHRLRFSHLTSINILKFTVSEIESLRLHIFSTENHQNQSQWLDPEPDQQNITGSVMGQQTVSSRMAGWIQKGQGSQI